MRIAERAPGSWLAMSLAVVTLGVGVIARPGPPGRRTSDVRDRRMFVNRPALDVFRHPGCREPAAHRRSPDPYTRVLADAAVELDACFTTGANVDLLIQIAPDGRVVS